MAIRANLRDFLSKAKHRLLSGIQLHNETFVSVSDCTAERAPKSKGKVKCQESKVRSNWYFLERCRKHFRSSHVEDSLDDTNANDGKSNRTNLDRDVATSPVVNDTQNPWPSLISQDSSELEHLRRTNSEEHEAKLAEERKELAANCIIDRAEHTEVGQPKVKVEKLLTWTFQFGGTQGEADAESVIGPKDEPFHPLSDDAHACKSVSFLDTLEVIMNEGGRPFWRERLNASYEDSMRQTESAPESDTLRSMEEFREVRARVLGYIKDMRWSDWHELIWRSHGQARKAVGLTPADAHLRLELRDENRPLWFANGE
ncbi:MAG: hypothetical protein M1818_008220 [Claussenomyces sp. TS43310]|nr:MAG: hypothetical protein M1818_008220 [Claussenomyces sp. TS43310]